MVHMKLLSTLQFKLLNSDVDRAVVVEFDLMRFVELVENEYTHRWGGVINSRSTTLIDCMILEVNTIEAT